MNKLKTEGGRTGGVDTKLQELEAQIKKADSDDAPLEKELELLKRTAIRESETLKWKALKEYGQKLALLATASEQLLRVLPSSPPEQYTGNQQTAAVRAALQNALDSGYAPKEEHLPLNVGNEIGETRSFGETHASELTTINTVTDNGHEGTAPINPAALNNAPAPLPSTSAATTHYNAPTTAPTPHYAAPSMGPPSSTTHATHYSPPTAAPGNTTSSTSVPHAPTVAETGVPVTAGAEGPGPATGTLNPSATEEVRDRPGVGYGVGTHEQAPAYGGGTAPSTTTHESAEDEKRRLAAADQAQTHANAGSHQGGLVASTSTRRPPAHESAEDEKRRLEREERERVLQQSNNSRGNTQDDTDPNGGAPPAYHD
ncbi:7703_t:CDS:2 [Acaulospora colombiana]|uniref:7703_t:CDS:1 n=1 Tax=Acaulospora colombiana TaxID=27376 RepID=A0ACA9Q0Q7_9GLOM|nr:7703_t:CDS:2 [Acaulospora colombiana]